MMRRARRICQHAAVAAPGGVVGRSPRFAAESGRFKRLPASVSSRPPWWSSWPSGPSYSPSAPTSCNCSVCPRFSPRSRPPFGSCPRASSRERRRRRGLSVANGDPSPIAHSADAIDEFSGRPLRTSDGRAHSLGETAGTVPASKIPPFVFSRLSGGHVRKEFEPLDGASAHGPRPPGAWCSTPGRASRRQRCYGSAMRGSTPPGRPKCGTESPTPRGSTKPRREAL